MKLKTLLTTVVLGLSLSTVSYANDINLSWSMRALQGQALTQTVKKAKNKQYLVVNQIQDKSVWHKIIYQFGLKDQANEQNKPFLKH